MILILTSGTVEKSVEEVYEWICYHGGNSVIMNSDELLDYICYTFELTSRGYQHHFFIGNRKVDLNSINVIWFWRWNLNPAIDQLYGSKKQLCDFMHEEQREVNRFIFSRLADKYWFGYKYVNKVVALLYAQALGIDYPDSIVTRKKDDLIQFISAHSKVITKTISNPVFLDENNSSFGMYTTRLTLHDIKQYPNTFFPMYVQEQIPKEYEIRSFYIDGSFYSAAILSQNDDQTKLDFRRYNHTKPNRVVPYHLPSEIERKLTELMNRLNLLTGSLDLIYYQNKYYFLEVNPVGQFDMISTPCNYNLGEIIAKHLISKDNENRNRIF